VSLPNSASIYRCANCKKLGVIPSKVDDFEIVFRCQRGKPTIFLEDICVEYEPETEAEHSDRINREYKGEISNEY
jgi:hypothetical protein